MSQWLFCGVSYTDSNKRNTHGFLATDAIEWQNLCLLVKFDFYSLSYR